MSDDYKYIDVDADEWEGTPRALREALDKAQKLLKAQTQQITEFTQEKQANALSGVLTGFKNPERVKSALLSDKVDPLNSEAVTKWLEANGDDYAKATGDPAPATNEQPSQPQGDPLANMRQIDAVATPASADKAEQVFGQITAEMNGDAVKKLLLQSGL